MISINDIEKAVEANKHKRAPFEKKFTEWALFNSSISSSVVTDTRISADNEEMHCADTQVEDFSRVIRLRCDIIGAQLSTLLKEAEKSVESFSINQNRNKKIKQLPSRSNDSSSDDMEGTLSGDTENRNSELNWRVLLPKMVDQLMHSSRLSSNNIDWGYEYNSKHFELWLDKMSSHPKVEAFEVSNDMTAINENVDKKSAIQDMYESIITVL